MDLVTIMDSVHGPIQLEKFLFKIIDTQEFQRLRKIKQFGEYESSILNNL